MCTALLPPGDNPVAVNTYIISSTPRRLKFKKMESDLGTGNVGAVLLEVAVTSLLQRLLSYEVRWHPCRKPGGQVENKYGEQTVQDVW